MRPPPETEIEVDISIAVDSWLESFPDPEELTTTTVMHVLSKASEIANRHPEVSIVLADNAFVQKLNREYRGKDKPTNVLSFPQYSPDELRETPDQLLSLGDVVLSLDVLKKEAVEQNKTLEDHFVHLLVHGVLHLLGYDHENPKDALKMESLEIELLQAMGIKNPYADDAACAIVKS